jgi:hypothetical protein
MTDQVNQEEQSAAPQLSLQDIATTVQVIDICSRRGGFEGAELSAVGGLRERFVAFLNANQQQGEAAPEGAVPAEEVEEEETVGS